LLTSPHQHTVVLVHRQVFSIDKFVFHRFNEVIIQLEAHHECPIGHSLFTLEQFEYLGENVIEGHSRPSARLPSPLYECLR
jgi:hypothetical protein